MKRPPIINVQLVHLQGPLKGEIQEFTQEVISVGRHPSATVRFPANLNVVSRQHADIVRDGNRFKLVDHSTNGTFVNGKKIKEVFLKNGDVIDFAQGGPKVSFLMQIQEGSIVIEEPPLQPPPPPPLQEKLKPSLEPQPLPTAKEQDVVAKNVQAPLVIQYGPTIRSFKKLPVTIGTHPSCDLTLTHPALFDQHAQIFFSQDQYWIKDLTGRASIQINHRPISLQAAMNTNDTVSLSSKGPAFRFIGGGRLAQIDEPLFEE